MRKKFLRTSTALVASSLVALLLASNGAGAMDQDDDRIRNARNHGLKYYQEDLDELNHPKNRHGAPPVNTLTAVQTIDTLVREMWEDGSYARALTCGRLSQAVDKANKHDWPTLWSPDSFLDTLDSPDVRGELKSACDIDEVYKKLRAFHKLSVADQKKKVLYHYAQCTAKGQNPYDYDDIKRFSKRLPGEVRVLVDAMKEDGSYPRALICGCYARKYDNSHSGGRGELRPEYWDKDHFLVAWQDELDTIGRELHPANESVLENVLRELYKFKNLSVAEQENRIKHNKKKTKALMSRLMASGSGSSGKLIDYTKKKP